ncbi:MULTISPECIES: hypothetical protein [unclassified Nocardioides]|uniref:hypothetical protein n=1 Tax=unclassified Nocardioides TaxID=2615069 RepID=UPI0009F0C1BE|nr:MULTISPECIES: hypothetical protein [unclassified Nocardioides]GAW50590.1 hypothetical protein PD653B2_2926 [Nocardioides sp. PD653-B2]GAW57476.1 hypothetical protein PD653_4921 [Nocardioides sp. PD653]
MSDPTTESDQTQVWFPDDQHGYSIALCVCTGGAYLGARPMGTPCCCERCGRLTREQWDFLVEHVTANLRMRYEASQAALGDLLSEHRVMVEAVEAVANDWHCDDPGCDREGGDLIRAALVYRPAECRWCPPGCKSCEPDDCECYTHQDDPDKATASCGFHAWGADDRCVTCGDPRSRPAEGGDDRG